MDSGRRDLAAGPESREAGASPLVHRDSSHVVVRRGHHRQEVHAGIDAGALATREDGRKVVRKAVPHRPARVQKSLAAERQLLPDPARHHVARRELRSRILGEHEAFAEVVDQRRTLTPQRLREQRQRVDVHRQGRGMELHELHVHQPRPGGRRESQAVAGRLGRIGREAVELSQATRGQDDLRRLVQNRAPVGMAREEPRHGALLHHELGGESSFEDLHPGSGADAHGERPHQLGAGRIAVGVQDPPPAVRGFPAEVELSAVGAIELGAELDQAPHRGDSVPRQELGDHRIDQPGAGGDRVGGVQLRRVADPHRHGHAALRPRTRARRESRLGQQIDAPAFERQSAGEAGDTRTDDHDVGPPALDARDALYRAARRPATAHRLAPRATSSMRSTARRARLAISGATSTR